MYLGLKKFVGQFIGIAVAGASHWENHLDDDRRGSFNPQIRLFMINTE
jgi:hypothetical protein